MATRMNLSEWNGQHESLNSWLERLEEYFVMEDVTDDRKQVACLLHSIGDRGYEIIKGLTAPALPKTKKVKELVKLLQDHISPRRSVMVERYKFQQVVQGSKTVTDFLSDLRQASEHCKFEGFYDQALRDRFVAGLSSDSIRKALLAEEDKITLDQAYQKALAREQAASESKVMGGTSVGPGTVSSHAVSYQGSRGGRAGPGRGGSSRSFHAGSGDGAKGGKSCKFCKLSMKKNKCTDRECNTKCFGCPKKGHSKLNCPKSKSNVKHTEVEFDDNFEDNLRT